MCAGWPSSSQASAGGRSDRNSRNSGTKSGSSGALDEEAVVLVEVLEIDHRLAAVAAFAVHVLEQMQRQRARAVEQQDVALLQIVEIAGRDLARSVREVDRARRAGIACSPAIASPISPAACCSSAVG